MMTLSDIKRRVRLQILSSSSYDLRVIDYPRQLFNLH